MVIPSKSLKVEIHKESRNSSWFNHVTRLELQLLIGCAPFFSTCYLWISDTGPWKSKALSSPSLTSDGRYLISVGKDSNVYIWNLANSRDARSVHSCELFFSKAVTTAVPWPGVYQDGHTKPSYLTEKYCSMPILRHHGECQSAEPWSFVDGSKGLATWPEEKLPSTAKPGSSPQLGDCLSMISAAWSTVIVTASRDGVIRSFHNYGLPVRLWASRPVWASQWSAAMVGDW
jgi:WD repeat-containing protein 44